MNATLGKRATGQTPTATPTRIVHHTATAIALLLESEYPPSYIRDRERREGDERRGREARPSGGSVGDLGCPGHRTRHRCPGRTPPPARARPGRARAAAARARARVTVRSSAANPTTRSRSASPIALAAPPRAEAGTPGRFAAAVAGITGSRATPTVAPPPSVPCSTYWFMAAFEGAARDEASTVAPNGWRGRSGGRTSEKGSEVAFAAGNDARTGPPPSEWTMPVKIPNRSARRRPTVVQDDPFNCSTRTPPGALVGVRPQTWTSCPSRYAVNGNRNAVSAGFRRSRRNDEPSIVEAGLIGARLDGLVPERVPGHEAHPGRPHAVERLRQPTAPRGSAAPHRDPVGSCPRRTLSPRSARASSRRRAPCGPRRRARFSSSAARRPRRRRHAQSGATGHRRCTGPPTRRRSGSSSCSSPPASGLSRRRAGFA